MEATGVVVVAGSDKGLGKGLLDLRYKRLEKLKCG